MTVLSVLDAAGRRRSPATLPGYHAGRAPRNKGLRYPPTRRRSTRSSPSCVTPATTVTAGACGRWSSCCGAPGCASRRRSRSASTISTPARIAAGPQRQGRAPARGRHGRLGLGAAAAVAERTGRAAGRAAVLHHRRPDSRAAVVGHRGALRVPPAGRPGGCPAQVRAASAPPRARARARPRGRAAEHHPAPARACKSRHDVDLPPGDRPRREHRGRAHAPRGDDVRQRRAAALSGAATTSGGAPGAPAPPGRSERPGGTIETSGPSSNWEVLEPSRLQEDSSPAVRGESSPWSRLGRSSPRTKANLSSTGRAPHPLFAELECSL